MTINRRILVVDDNPEVAESIMHLINKYGEVDIASSGSEAIEACESKNYDAVLLDVQFEYGMSGLEAAAIVRQNHPNIRIIIMSALDYSTQVQERAVQLGATFLQKTVKLHEILHAFGEDWDE